MSVVCWLLPLTDHRVRGSFTPRLPCREMSLVCRLLPLAAISVHSDLALIQCSAEGPLCVDTGLTHRTQGEADHSIGRRHSPNGYSRPGAVHTELVLWRRLRTRSFILTRHYRTRYAEHSKRRYLLAKPNFCVGCEIASLVTTRLLKRC